LTHIRQQYPTCRSLTYNLKLADSFQVAAAIVAGCDAFLTNDSALKRVNGITILALDELEV
jgi:predicted nucleic acid-binding protein